MELKVNEYKCEMCHEVYEKGWTDEEALEEAARIFGKPMAEWNCGQSIICDDCFEKINPLKTENVEKLIKARETV